MAQIKPGQHRWPNATGVAVALTLAMVGGVLWPTISPVDAVASTTTGAVTTPPDANCSASVSGSALSRNGWVASTNAASSGADAPGNAIDGNLTTRFSTGEAQADGQYLELNLGSAQTFDELEMRTPSATSDYARGYDVEVSPDGTSWLSVASCTGTATPEVVSFPTRTARYLRVVLTASSSDPWTVDELNLYNNDCSASVSGSALSRNGWVASTNAASSGADAPGNAIDGNLTTRFSTGEAQADGQYLELNLGSAQTFDELEMRTPSATSDYARGYDVEVSPDGTSWLSVASCTGTATPEIVSFPTRTARYLRVVLTASSSDPWSVDELNLYNAGLAITSASTWTVAPGRADTFTVTTTGIPAPALSVSGTLPPGLGFKDNGNGTATISGTVPAGSRGTYELTITASNGVGSPAVQDLTVTLGTAPAITSASTWHVAPGQASTFTVSTTGTPAPALSESGTLPPGLAFHSKGNGTATISGTVPAGDRGTYAVTITASNGVGSPAVQDLTVTLGGSAAITSASAWRVLPGQFNAFTVTTAGSPTPIIGYSGVLPRGLVFQSHNNGTATISGTVPAGTGGTYEVTITATNGVGSPAVQYLLITLGGSPTITSASGWRVVPGQFNAFTVTTYGSPVPTLSASGGTLPPGLSFKYNLNGTATISGNVPASARGTYEVRITATNGEGSPAVQYLVMTLGGSRTAISLSSSANPVSVGQVVTYTAKVAPAPNGATVSFTANGALIAGCSKVPVNTTTGYASCSASFASTGERAVQASYSGDAAFGPSASGFYAEVVNLAPAGYWIATANGAVYGLGSARSLGGITTSSSTGRVVGIAATPDAKGYWVVTADGKVGAFGDAKYYGDLPGLGKHVTDIVAIAATSDGKGYYLVGADGGFFAFGDAKFHGSLPGVHVHVKDVVGVVTTPGGKGYLLVGADGGVFTFGSTHFYGSLPGIGKHVHDIRAILPSSTGRGYILVGSDGGVFNFGSGAKFHGSLPGEGVVVSNIVGIALTPDDGGYYMAGSLGHVYGFGDAHPAAEPSGLASNLPVAAIAGT